ncbi:NADH-quinone oxidoreductase subunit A [Adhaeribacter pallidiroseus]|uniref:NADH-quinone oxidoreductase subunit A n=1 Tax=Adhaeribacter pallidiroseus TaxID=2072847 RepID=A0A369QM55_9BACT|nr:NADH-quinone oxidoreductase subunit A [Adhaeribacter pallidiroseus]RDC66023.1 NADH:ubiquinone reductase (H(+)-translocating) [Adhaeribacter pallidiroseus]
MNQSYLSDFGTILLFLIGGGIFILIGLATARLIRPAKPNAEKLSSYECGEEALGSSWVQFNPRFYIIALIFIIFDVELAFLFPWAVVFGQRSLIEETDGLWGWFALTEMVIFIAILALGLAYAWAKGHLDWVKQKPVIPESISKIPLSAYSKINAQRYEVKKEVIEIK